jgi:hypothetical protein
MTPNDPKQQTSAHGGEPPAGEGAPPGPPDRGDDPLDALRERIRRTQDAVERLADEAAQSAPAGGDPPDGGAGEAAGRPPPHGYATPGSAERDRTATREAQAFVALLDVVRGLLPSELQHQVAELLRELLLLLRALIDWYLERLDARRKRPVEVEDIPIS